MHPSRKILSSTRGILEKNDYMKDPQTNKEEAKVKQPPKAESKVEDKQPAEEQIAEHESQTEDEPKKESNDNDGLALGVILAITAIMAIASIPLFSMV